MIVKNLIITKKNRKYFAAEDNGYKCKILIDDNSKNLEVGEHELLIEDISVRSKYGTDLIYKLHEEHTEADIDSVTTLRHYAYNQMLVEECRKLNGRWDKESQAWVFSSLLQDKVEELDDVFNSDLIDIEMTTLSAISKKNDALVIFGIPVCRARDRDSGAKVCDNVALVAGKISSGGSRKNWCTEVESGTRFRFKVPQKLFDLHVDDYISAGEVTFTKL